MSNLISFKSLIYSFNLYAGHVSYKVKTEEYGQIKSEQLLFSCSFPSFGIWLCHISKTFCNSLDMARCDQWDWLVFIFFEEWKSNNPGITQPAKKNGNLQHGTEFVHKADSSLHFYLFWSSLPLRSCSQCTSIAQRLIFLSINHCKAPRVRHALWVSAWLEWMHIYSWERVWNCLIFELAAHSIYWIQRSQQEDIICLIYAFTHFPTFMCLTKKSK